MRARSRLVAGGASVLMLTALFGVIGTTSAEARCAGNTAVNSNFYYGDQVAPRAEERPVSGTCDGSNGVYTARLYDLLADSHTVRVWWDGENDNEYKSIAAAGGDWGNGVEYTSNEYYTFNGVKHAKMKLCIFVSSTGVAHCGWGHTSGGYGDNYGF